jgi:hypothetical protein
MMGVSVDSAGLGMVLLATQSRSLYTKNVREFQFGV